MLKTKRGLTALRLSANMLCFLACASGQQGPSKGGAALEELRQIGAAIMKAVPSKDATALLRYQEEPRLRADNERLLKDKNSDLYCFLIANHPGCAGVPVSTVSVFKRMSSARQLAVTVHDLGESRVNQIHYALLIFYDRSVFSPQSLQSAKFYCEPHNAERLNFWTFQRVNGKWSAATNLFELETDGPC
jgi:hypothetical protein